MLENHKLKNEVDAKSERMKELRKEIDTMKQTTEEERTAWKTKEAEYRIKLDSVSAKKTDGSMLDF